jgi:hypothetical protein
MACFHIFFALPPHRVLVLTFFQLPSFSRLVIFSSWFALLLSESLENLAETIFSDVSQLISHFLLLGENRKMCWECSVEWHEKRPQNMCVNEIEDGWRVRWKKGSESLLEIILLWQKGALNSKSAELWGFSEHCRLCLIDRSFWEVTLIGRLICEHRFHKLQSTSC